jgi:hypothetical protein
VGTNRLIIGLLIVSVVFVAGCTSTTPGYKTVTSNIVNGLITVDAGGYNTYQFSVPDNAIGATISGSFLASGGSGNDIEVFVMSTTDFINWKNGHQSNVYYQSGKMTTQSISASLPSGSSLYLVYSNTFSTVTKKNVQTKVDLTYQTTG